MNIRSASERKAHALARLERDPSVWLATASPGSGVHAVPLSMAWIDGSVVVATPSSTKTARNAASSPHVRACLDGTGDVVIVDGVAETINLGSVDDRLIASYVERVGWDPREQSDGWSLILVRPDRVQVWNSVGEIDGRDVMIGGRWVAD